MLARIAWNASQTNPLQGQIILGELIATLEEMNTAPHAKLYTGAKLCLFQMTDDDSEAVKKFLRDNTLTLKELSSSTESEVAAVHSAYYQTAMELYKKIGPAQEFYKHAIQFLHYTPLFTMDPADSQALARDLCLAALVGEGVYNLGTVVYENAELLAVLKGGEDGYLVELMKSAAEGDVGAVKTLEVHQAKLEGSGCDVKVIQEKVMLLALVNMVFEKGSSERTMKFGDIGERLQVEAEQVEWIVMKALSLGLIKGSMDQVDGVVDVTWVMPRVLDENMMKGLATRFEEWAAKVGETREYMGERIPAF